MRITIPFYIVENISRNAETISPVRLGFAYNPLINKSNMVHLWKIIEIKNFL